MASNYWFRWITGGFAAGALLPLILIGTSKVFARIFDNGTDLLIVDPIFTLTTPSGRVIVTYTGFQAWLAIYCLSGVAGMVSGGLIASVKVAKKLLV